jgi:hypothetical protein
VFEINFDLREYDFNSANLMELAPEIGLPGIVRLDVQRLPDTRVHCIRSDGTAAVAIISKNEDVLAWVEITTDGEIEDVCVLPALNGDLDDQVYYVVKRTINGSTVRYLEKWAQESECQGGELNCQSDSYIEYTGSPTNTITAAHLANEEVVVWADGLDVGTDDSNLPWVQRYTANASGVVTLNASYSNIVVGLGYNARFKSAKLGTAGQVSPLNQQKKINHIGLVLAKSHPRGVRFGPYFDGQFTDYYMDDMPLIEDGELVGDSVISDYDSYDQNFIEFPGTWTTNLRLCLQAQAPRPCTVLAVTMDLVRFA